MSLVSQRNASKPTIVQRTISIRGNAQHVNGIEMPEGHQPNSNAVEPLPQSYDVQQNSVASKGNDVNTNGTTLQ